MVKHISIFNIFFLKQLTLHTLLNEVVYVEMFNSRSTIEVKILWQQHEYLFKKKAFIYHRS